MTRSTAAGVSVLILAAVLGATGVVWALRAKSSAALARDQLWESLVSQGRAERLSGEIGGRTKALHAIREAAAIRPTEQLRDEAIASLALLDLVPLTQVPTAGAGADRIAFSPNLDSYALAGEGRLSVYKAEGNERLMEFNSLPFYPERVSFSPDGRLIAVHYFYGSLVVCDTVSQKEVWRTQLKGTGAPVCELSFDGTGTLAVSAVAEGKLLLYEAATGKELRRIDAPAGARECGISGDGTRLAMASDSTVVIEELATGERESFAVGSDVTFLRWHPDNERIAVGCYSGQVSIIDPPMRAQLPMREHGSTVDWLAFSADGRHLMGTGWDGVTRIWDTNQGTQRLSTDLGRGRGFDLDGVRLAFYREYSSIGFWKFVTSPVYQGYAPPSAGNEKLFTVEISPDNRWLTAQSDNGSHYVWNVDSGRLSSIVDHRELIGSRFTADGQSLFGVTRHKDVRFWPFDSDLGKPKMEEGDIIEGLSNGEWGVLRVDVRGRNFATIYDSSGQAFAISLEQDGVSAKRLLTDIVREIGICNITTSLDRKWAVGSFWKNRSTLLWDLEEGRMVRELDAFGGDAVFFPGGKYLGIGSHQGLAVWDIGSWTEIKKFPRVASSSIPSGVKYSFDGRFGAYENTPVTTGLIDLATLELAATFTNPGQPRIGDTTFSDNGDHLIVSADGKLHAWNLPVLRDELAALGLNFGKQESHAIAPSALGAFSLDPNSAATIAVATMLVALVFGLYTMLYQHRMVRDFATVSQTLEKTQRELAQSEKMKALGTLSAGVAHDFKNLLSVIRLSNDLIRRDAGDRSDIMEEVDAIATAVSQGDHVVRAMLGYSRRRSDGHTLATNVGDVVDGIVALLGQQFLSGVALTVEVDKRLPPTVIPQGALEQILLNLVVNASEAMGGQGKLAIAVKQVKLDDLEAHHPGEEIVLHPQASPLGWIAIIVEDNGVGISPETCTRIFEPFFTTKNVGSDRGTGLGLSTVYKICANNGLGLRLGSAPGSGTRFTLALPVTAENDGVLDSHTAIL
ncbi:MAG: hypothetical protein KDN22_23510 [Verrucomicrobiae bacterium]|nr:hypothetical protein [Verrucomicrobiae bacterium]